MACSACFVIGGQDDYGEEIVMVFHKTPHFIIYWSKPRAEDSDTLGKVGQRPYRGGTLRIRYADDPALAMDQRRAVAPLLSITSDIESLVEDWREGRRKWLNPFSWFRDRDRRRAEFFTWRLADSTQRALLGDNTTALALLEQTKRGVVAERKARGRYNYLLTALVLALLIVPVTVHGAGMAGLTGFTTIGSGDAGNATWADLSSLRWRLGAVGAFGAFFSITIGLRDRAIEMDSNSLNNVVDSAVRILVGAIAGVVMGWLLFSRVLPLELDLTPAEGGQGGAAQPEAPADATDPGGSPGPAATSEEGAPGSAPDPDENRSPLLDFLPAAFRPPHSDLMKIYLAAFIAGFAERLVPDLLGRTALARQEPQIPPPPTPLGGKGGTETNPTGEAPVPPAPPPPAPAPEHVAAPGEVAQPETGAPADSPALASPTDEAEPPTTAR